MSMADEVARIGVKVPKGLPETAMITLEKEGLTIAEYVRLCLLYVSENGRPPFEVPASSRGKQRRRNMGRMLAGSKGGRDAQGF